MNLAASSDAGSTALGLVLIIFGIAAYWSPTIIGALMHKHNLGTIAVWNFFGWFFFVPWIMAWVKVAEKAQQPTVIIQPPYGWVNPPPGFGPPPAPRPQQPSPTGELPEGYR